MPDNAPQPTIMQVWSETPRPASWFAQEAQKEAKLMMKGVPLGLPSGFATIDRTFRMREGQLTVIAARSSMGKTSLALQMATHNALRLQQQWDDGCILFFSAEMSGSELFQKMASTRSGLNLQDGYAGRWTPAQGQMFHDTLDDLSTLPLIVSDANRVKTDSMRDGIQMLIDAGKPPRAVFFDYIEIGADDDKYQEHQRVAAIVTRLKKISLDFKLPVIALSQINRDLEKESGTRMPLLHNLAGSDSVGRTADKVLTMMIPQTYLKTGVSCACEHIEDSRNTAYLSVQKDRFGARGTTWRLHFDPQTASFQDLDSTDPRGPFVHKLNTRNPSEAESYWARLRDAAIADVNRYRTQQETQHDEQEAEHATAGEDGQGETEPVAWPGNGVRAGHAAEQRGFF